MTNIVDTNNYKTMDEAESANVQLYRHKHAFIKIKKLIKIYKPVADIMKELEEISS